MKRLLLLVVLCSAIVPTATAGVTRLPMTVVRTWLTVEVAIEGHTYRFMVDTGAPLTVVSARVAAERNIVAGDVTEMNTTNGVPAAMRHAVVGRMTLGDRELTDWHILVADNTILDCFDIDGIIGGDILRRYVVRFCARDGYILLADNLLEAGAVDRRHSVRMRLINNKSYCGYSYIRGAKGKCPVWLLFDTGAAGLSLGCWERLAERGALSDLHVAEGYSIVGGLMGNGVASHTAQALAVAPVLRFAGVDIRNMPVQSLQQEQKSIIGVALLQWGDVVADYRGRRIYYVVDGQSVSAGDGAAVTFNLRPAFDAGRGVIVGSVWDTDLLGRVRVGDRISSVDGMPTDSMNVCDFYRLDFKIGQTQLCIETDAGEEYITMNIIE